MISLDVLSSMVVNNHSSEDIDNIRGSLSSLAQEALSYNGIDAETFEKTRSRYLDAKTSESEDVDELIMCSSDYIKALEVALYRAYEVIKEYDSGSMDGNLNFISELLSSNGNFQ